jgi:hypothetical protein
LDAARAAVAEARQYGAYAEHPSQSMYGRAFVASIRHALPDFRPVADEYVIKGDADIAWILRDIDASGVGPVASQLFTFLSVGGHYRPHWRNMLGHRLHRIRQTPAAWGALVSLVRERMKPLSTDPYPFIDRERVFHREATSIFQGMQEVFGSDIERTRFDASQLERHMAMTHHVPADVSNLIGQFATTGITPQAPVPLRL